MANNLGYNMGNNMNMPYNNNLIMNTPYNNYMAGNIQTQQQYYLKCRPVSSREQAMAFQIDLDGSLWVFPNTAKGRIYTKQINNDGTATFNTYILTEENEETNNFNLYVTREEFNRALEQIMAAMPNKTQPQVNIPSPERF